jgi:hypothetical protein
MRVSILIAAPEMQEPSMKKVMADMRTYLELKTARHWPKRSIHPHCVM